MQAPDLPPPYIGPVNEGLGLGEAWLGLPPTSEGHLGLTAYLGGVLGLKGYLGGAPLGLPFTLEGHLGLTIYLGRQFFRGATR